MLGQDANWDLRNYHLYNPWAILEGRWGIDHHPAGVAGFLNPALDVLVYPLLTAVPDYVGGALLGAFQGLAFFALFVLAREAFGANMRALPMAALATVGGATSAMTISEIGMTFGDLTTAVPVLAALALGIRACTRPDGERLPWRIGAAGALLGIAMGLKLTNGLFALGFAAATALAVPGSRLRSLSWLLAPAALGLAVTHGPWSAFLWSHFGNPVFPFFNAIFESPFAIVANISDNRFRPRSLSEGLLFPFYFGFNSRTTEVPFRDLRMAAAYFAVPLLAVALVARARFARPWSASAPPARATAFLIAFFAVGYLAWFRLFAIGRYIVVLEMLAPLMVLMLVARYIEGPYRTIVAAACVAALILTTHVADWGRTAWDGGPWSRVRNFEAPAPGSAVILGEAALAFLAPTVNAKDVAWVGTNINGEFAARDQEELEKRIAGRPLYLANFVGSSAEFGQNLRGFGLKPDGACTVSWSKLGSAVVSKLGGAVVLCPVTRGQGIDVAAIANESAKWSFEITTSVKAIALAAGESGWVRLRMRNTGERTAWAALHEARRLAGVPNQANALDHVSASYHIVREDGAMVVYDGLRTRLPRSLAPGESVEIDMCISAPPQRGTYLVKPDVVHEGVRWVNERVKGTPIMLTVR